MALRIGFKIHRYLGQNKFKYFLQDAAPRNNSSSSSSKPKYVLHPVRRLKSSSTNILQKHYANSKPTAAAAAVYRDGDLEVLESSNLQPAAMAEYYSASLDSRLANFPRKADLEVAGGRLSKSSTQSALTQPLKLPRLANPFPERLKSFPSDTLADDEKAQLMHEEVKLAAARQHLPQEAAPPSPAAADHHQQQQQQHYFVDEFYWRAAAAPDVQVQERRHQVRTKPRMRSVKAPRRINSLAQRRQYSSDSATLHPHALTDVEQCDAILEHLRAHYPDEYRALKRPLFVPGSREEREFIQTTLRYIAKHRPDVKRAPAPFPSYSEVKTFVREPTLRENRATTPLYGGERGFKAPLWMENLARKYSTASGHLEAVAEDNPMEVSAVKVAEEETATYFPFQRPSQRPGAHLEDLAGTATQQHSSSRSKLEEEAHCALCQQAVTSTGRPGAHLEDLAGAAIQQHSSSSSRSELEEEAHCQRAVTSTGRPGARPGAHLEDLAGTAAQQHGSSRAFSTRPKSCKPDKKKVETCKTMKSPGCADPYPPKCEHVYEATTCKKLTAPYPSYSECMGDQYEDEPSECKICPWRKPPGVTPTNNSGSKKQYSTSCSSSAAVLLGPKKKKQPCESPYNDKKPCDYERTAQKHDELRHKRPVHNAHDAPAASGGGGGKGHKKSFSTLAGGHTPAFTTLSTADNVTIVDRIKDWLHSWRAGSDRVRITKSAHLSDGRETYIIEIQDVPAVGVVVEQQQQQPTKQPEAAAVVVDVASVLPPPPSSAGLSCAESGKKSDKLPGAGCPPSRKKTKETDDGKKKCRQRKKRKLPSCHDVGREKPTRKDALNYSTIDITAGAAASTHTPLCQQRTREIAALQQQPEPLASSHQYAPFQLKPQFWRL